MADPFDSFRLTVRVAVVTGASGSLGAELARVLARAGAVVVLAARRTGPKHALAAELTADGARAHVQALDVTDPDSVTQAIAQAGVQVDLLINNSGIATPGTVLDADGAGVMPVNLDRARRTSVAVARRLVQVGRCGAIVNVASILGLRQGAGVGAYAVSRTARSN